MPAGADFPEVLRMPLFAATIFLSALLLFQVQPLMGKFVLPWFGGTPAVWTTCMVFFQLLLLGGYAYAHLIIRFLTPRRQGQLHIALLLLSLLFLPIIPSESWKPTDGSAPAWHILAVLAITVGVPYLLLSATGPLVQAWFARARPGASPYRLYALSNLGSLLGLLSYPFIVEPNLRLSVQGYMWSAGFALFVIACGACAVTIYRAAGADAQTAPPPAEKSVKKPAEKPIRVADRVYWILLATCGSVVLLATTNQMCQDVAAVPLLWVLPLSLYLISFIVCFESDRWYIRPIWLTLLPLTMAGAFTAMVNYDLSLVTLVSLYSAVLFCGCMVCHGELARMRPGPQHLTQFYLLLSAGGAMGGIGVSLVAPAFFNGYWEFPGGIIATCVLALSILYREQRAPRAQKISLKERQLNLVLLVAGFIPAAFIVLFVGSRLASTNDAIHKMYGDWLESRGFKASVPIALDSSWQYLCFVFFALAMLIWTLPLRRRRQIMLATLGLTAVAMGGISAGLLQELQALPMTLASARNFYGVLHVESLYHKDSDKPYARRLVHGRITHGQQFLGADSRTPTSYYIEESGIGIAERAMMQERRDTGEKGVRTGVIGLGAGTMAAYGRTGDYLRFYEINADVLRLCDRYFTYRSESPAKNDVELGDARITLEREKTLGEAQNFDILVVDAFSGDAIPLHLLTREAFALYFHHLKPDGVLAVHISNRYLDLAPLVRGLAEDQHRTASLIEVDSDPEIAGQASEWVLVTSNQSFLNCKLVKEAITPWSPQARQPILFTDDFSNVYKLVR